MRLDYGILCDQVRKEDNGKLLFIGIYTSDIKVPLFPGLVPLTLVLAFSGARIGRDKVELTAYLNGKMLVSGTTEIDIVSDKRSFAVFPNIPFNLREKGILEIIVEMGGESLKAWVGDVSDQST